MPKRKQHRPRCKFCGALGVTEEHALGRQFHKILPGAGWYVHRTWDPDQPLAGPMVKRAKTPAFTARIACASCNGGWMATVDNEVATLVVSMSRGRAVVLDREAYGALAAWAAKVILVMSTKEPARRRFAPDSVYSEMGATHRPPVAMTLWLGAVNSLDPMLFRSNDVRFRDGVHGYGATLSVGRLAFHCVARPDGGAPDLRLRHTADRSFRRISPDPNGPVKWPPRQILQLNDLLYIPEGVANMSTIVGAS